MAAPDEMNIGRRFGQDHISCRAWHNAKRKQEIYQHVGKSRRLIKNLQQVVIKKIFSVFAKRGQCGHLVSGGAK